MFSRKVSVVVVASVLATGLVAGVAQAAEEGELNERFGSAGKVTRDIQFAGYGALQVANAVALTSDNGIVIAGYNQIYYPKNQGAPADTADFLVSKFSLDGSIPNPEFNGFGNNITDFSNGHDLARAVAVQDNGFVVVAGSAETNSQSDFALARYEPNGALDLSFGEVDQNYSSRRTGKLVLDVSGSNEDDAVEAIAIQRLANSEEKIVVAGSSSNGTYYDIALARFDLNGDRDETFGDNGKVVMGVRAINRNDYIYDLAIQPDGKIIVVGSSSNGSSDDFLVMRFNVNGTPDTSFSGDGIVIIDLFPSDTRSDVATSVAISPINNNIVVTGFFSGPARKSAVIQIDQDGNRDTTFGGVGNDGVVRVSSEFTDTNDIVTGVAVQSDGKIVLAGTANFSDYGLGANNLDNFFVTRLHSDGTTDGSFSRGQVITDFNGLSDQANDLVIQPDGGIVVVGSTLVDAGVNLPHLDLALARYTGDAVAPTATMTRAGSGSLTKGQSETVSITLSEPSTDFVESDVDVTNGSVVLTGEGTSYSAVVTPVDNSVGTVTVTIPAGAFTDKASLANASATSLTIDFDTLRSPSSAGGTTGSGTAGGTSNPETGGSVNGLISYKTGNKKITFTFTTIPNASRYLLTNSAGRTVCDTTATSCTVRNLVNGKATTYTFGFQDTSGAVQTGIDSVRAMAGFKLGASTAKVRKKVALTKFVSTPSQGKKTWRVTKGQCRISGNRLIMPTKTGRCTLKLSVAKKASYPAMSTSVRITVTR